MIKHWATFSTMMAFALSAPQALADRLEDIRKAGIVRVAIFDSNPPFGFTDQKTQNVVGLDMDFAKAIAQKMGVKLEITPTNPANRMPLLLNNKVDLVVANFTITPERARHIQFSIPYFASGQQFLAKKGKIKKPEDVQKMRVGVDKGTVNEGVLRKAYPKVTVVAYDDTPFAFAALRNGKVDAITQDGPKLIGLLALAEDGQQYEVPPFSISQDLIGIGMPKGEDALKKFVDDVLLELEKNGQADKIHNTWFGPQTKTPLARLHKITPENNASNSDGEQNPTK